MKYYVNVMYIFTESIVMHSMENISFFVDLLCPKGAEPHHVTWVCLYMGLFTFSTAMLLALFHCLPKGRHSDGPHEFQGCSSQKYSKGWGGWVMQGGVGWVIQGWGGVGHAGVGWGGSCMGGVGHEGMGVGGSCRVGWVMKGWVGCVMQGWGGVGHAGVGWGGSSRGGVGHAGVGGGS